MRDTHSKTLIALITSLLMFFSASVMANSEVQLDASFVVVSSTSDANGSNTIDMQVTLSNTSAVDLLNLRMEIIDNELITDIVSSVILIDSLNVNSSATVDLVVRSTMPADMLSNGVSLMLTGEALDTSSQAHAVIAGGTL